MSDNISLEKLDRVVKDFKTRFPDITDTHIFANAEGLDLIRSLCMSPASSSVSNLMGMEVWHDPSIPDGEIHLGRITRDDDGFPVRVVTKVIFIRSLQ